MWDSATLVHRESRRLRSSIFDNKYLHSQSISPPPLNTTFRTREPVAPIIPNPLVDTRSPRPLQIPAQNQIHHSKSYTPPIPRPHPQLFSTESAFSAGKRCETWFWNKKGGYANTYRTEHLQDRTPTGQNTYRTEHLQDRTPTDGGVCTPPEYGLLRVEPPTTPSGYGLGRGNGIRIFIVSQACLGRPL